MSGTEKNLPISFASVAVSLPLSSEGELTYHVPEAFQERLRPGMRVLVPIGRRKATGIVVKTKVLCDLPDRTKVKDILDIMDEGPIFSEDLLNLWEWSKSYYLTSPGEMLNTILPSSLKREGPQMVKLGKTLKGNKRSAGGEFPDSQNSLLLTSLTAAEQALIAIVAEKKRVSTKTLQRRVPTLSLGKVLRKLEALGVIELSDHLPRQKILPASPFAITVSVADEGNTDFVLSAAQEEAWKQIAAALQSSVFRVFLLHGVTGSGKTEVYLKAAQEVINGGRSVLMLVPEIGLTQQLIEWAQQRFGKQVAVQHSALTASQRLAEWWRVVRGEAPVVIGVRSAVFAPLPRLGLIVVDEEHDTSYKQEDGVRYNARDLAIMRGKIAACPVILGSATPSLESYTHSRTHRYTRLAIPERVESRPLPSVEIVDLRQEARAGNSDKIFSTALRDALLANYRADKQSLLFLNRRGYANYLQCHLCGEALSCSQCSVTLRLHLKERVLRCHYCGLSQPAPESCPRCQGGILTGHGFGTEQVEEALRRCLPKVRVGRLDRDSVSRREALSRVLNAWRRHEIDVLIGTQMVAKGHDVPNVTLVGVLLADVSLNIPDFRAAERTFQLLTQVAGRAGRGQEPGRVIIQTYMPDHYSIRFATRHDFERFATYELRYRKRLGYPPFTRMVNIRIEGKEGEKVQACADKVAHFLLANTQGESDPPVVLGPAPAPIERVKGRERWQVLLKGQERRTLHALVRKMQEALFSQRQVRGMRIIVDVDPYSML